MKAVYAQMKHYYEVAQKEPDNDIVWSVHASLKSPTLTVYRYQADYAEELEDFEEEIDPRLIAFDYYHLMRRFEEFLPRDYRKDPSINPDIA